MSVFEFNSIFFCDKRNETISILLFVTAICNGFQWEKNFFIKKSRIKKSDLKIIWKIEFKIKSFAFNKFCDFSRRSLTISNCNPKVAKWIAVQFKWINENVSLKKYYFLKS